MMLSHFARRARFVIALLLFACAFIFANQLADDQNAAGSHNIIWAVASFMSTVQGALMLRADWLEKLAPCGSARGPRAGGRPRRRPRIPHQKRRERRLEVIPSSDWLDEAACSVFELDTNLFFERQSGRVRKAVQQICRECPVRKQCLEHALTYEVRSPRPPQYGIFGGLTPTERRELWQERRDIMKDLEKRTRELAEKVEKIRSQGK